MPKVVFVTADGQQRQSFDAEVGESLLEIARRFDIDIEGACEGCMACATCHVVVAPEWFEKLPAATEDEIDMLDLVFDLERTSRLGCQVTMTEALDGLTVRLPEATRNLLLS